MQVKPANAYSVVVCTHRSRYCRVIDEFNLVTHFMNVLIDLPPEKISLYNKVLHKVYLDIKHYFLKMDLLY